MCFSAWLPQKTVTVTIIYIYLLSRIFLALTHAVFLFFLQLSYWHISLSSASSWCSKVVLLRTTRLAPERLLYITTFHLFVNKLSPTCLKRKKKKKKKIRALGIIIFHYVYCTHQMSDTMCAGNLDVYRFSHSHKIYLLQSKTKYMHMLVLYIFLGLFVYTEPYSLYRL